MFRNNVLVLHNVGNSRDHTVRVADHHKAFKSCNHLLLAFLKAFPDIFYEQIKDYSC